MAKGSAQYRDPILLQDQNQNGSWFTVAQRMAKVRYLTGNEVEQTEVVKPPARVEVTIRLMNFPTTWRIIWKGRILHPVAVMPSYDREQQTIIQAIDTDQLYEVISEGGLTIA